ncbi:InlB B-repeat-containing protein [Enterococcus sp.]|uniref:InlB B-repeat-containing protein n=1 Tax=Enterococcus sp. TaxID=35783 RepID=UPI002908F01A|nr:InlB B-repeat-containing protein [Enterococcus sp.]MDU5336410.1 InlB B-repeat-containing protein [Enterococcus sp.]
MKKMIRCFIVYLLLAPVVSPTIEVVFAEIKETAETSSISETKSSTTDQKEQPEQTTMDSTQPFSSQDNSKISEIPTSTSEKNQTISDVLTKSYTENVEKSLKAIVPEPTPSISVILETEQLINFDPAASYKLLFNYDERSVSGTPDFVIDDEMHGKVWSIIRLGNGTTTENSVAQRLTIPRRNSIYEERIGAVDESKAGAEDGQLTGVTFEQEYRPLGTNQWLSGTSNGKITNLKPGDYQIRTKSFNGRFASLPLVRTIRASASVQEETPNIGINYKAEELTNFDSNASYKLTHGSNEKRVSGTDNFKIEEDMFGKVWNVFRLGNGSTTQNSEAQSLTIKHRTPLHESNVTPKDESAAGKQDGELSGVDLDREYRPVGTTDWLPGSSNGTVKNLAPGEYEIRYTAREDIQRFASLPIKKTIKAGLPREETPKITINYETEQLLNFDPSASYKLTFGTTEKSVSGTDRFNIEEEMFGKVWKVYRLGNASTTQDSEAQQLTIPHRLPLYENMVEVQDESAAGEKDGMLINVDLERQYRPAGTQKWLAGSQTGKIENLAPGEYEIRYKAQPTRKNFASLPIKKTIKAGLPREETPEITINYETEELLNFDPNVSYKLLYGSNEVQVSGTNVFTIKEEMFGKGWRIIRKGNGSTTQDSEAQNLTIPHRLPLYEDMVKVQDESAAGEKDGVLINVDLDRQYRPAGTQEWLVGSQNGKIENLAPGEYEIRYKAQPGNKKFASLPIKKTIKAGLPREETPEITINYETEELLNFDPSASYKLTYGQTEKIISSTEIFAIEDPMFGEDFEVIRLGDGNTTQDSKSQKGSVNARPKLDEKVITVENESIFGLSDGKLMGVNPDLEFRKKGSKDWTAGVISGIVENLSSGDYEIRYSASQADRRFVSQPITKTIKAGPEREATPTVQINYEQELLSNFDKKAKYRLTCESTERKVSDVEILKLDEAMLNGKEWKIIRLADGEESANNEPQLLSIKQRPIMPESKISVVNESRKGKSDGRLEGITGEFEYRKEGTSNWLKGNQNGLVDSLATGNYQIRLAASDEMEQFASLSITKTIHAGPVLEANTFIVSFETNGGSLIAKQTVKRNQQVVRPKDPEKNGYTFTGWFADKELTKAWDFSNSVTEHLTLYAKWSQNIQAGKTSTNSISNNGNKTSSNKPAVKQTTAKQYMKTNDTRPLTPILVGLVMIIILSAFLWKNSGKQNSC